MSEKSKKILSALLFLATMLSFFSMPLTAGSFFLDTSGTGPNWYDIQYLANYIENFDHGGSGSGLKATVTGDKTLTVTGGVRDAKNYMQFTMVSTWHVTWKASYSGSVPGNYLISMDYRDYDNGKDPVQIGVRAYFDMQGTITSSGAGAIGVRGSHITLTIDGSTISGGKVFCDGAAAAINTDGASVRVQGASAKVRSEYGPAIYSYKGGGGIFGGIVIKDGEISSGQYNADSTSCAIQVHDTNVTIDGGLVFSNRRIAPDQTPTINDVIKSTGNGAVTVNSGLVVSFNRRFETYGPEREFEEFSSTDLWWRPRNPTIESTHPKIRWENYGFSYGENYENFFEVSGIEVYKTHTVTFDCNGGFMLVDSNTFNGNTIKVRRNTLLPASYYPTKPGYYFDGWYRDPNLLTYKFDFEKERVHNDFTLYAKWTPNMPAVIRHTITFKPENGDETTYKYVFDGVIANPPENPKPKDGIMATFLGWYTGPQNVAEIEEETQETGSGVTLMEENTFNTMKTVEKTSDLITDLKINDLKTTAEILEALKPVERYYFMTPVTKSFTLYAHWQTRQKVTFNPNGGIIEIFELMERYYTVIQTGMTLTYHEAYFPTKEGHIFEGWYADQSFTEEYTFDKPITKDIILYAKWKVSPTILSTSMPIWIDPLEYEYEDEAAMDEDEDEDESEIEDEDEDEDESEMVDDEEDDEDEGEEDEYDDEEKEDDDEYEYDEYDENDEDEENEEDEEYEEDNNEDNEDEDESEDEVDEDDEDDMPESTDTEPWENLFADVFETDWYYNDVKFACELGLINGKTPVRFAPEENLTYAEAVKLAACMHQLDAEGFVTLAIGEKNWYDTYVEYAKANGIINKDYNWDAPATRAGYMEIFANALPDAELSAINSIADNSIPDVPSSHPQSAAIYKLYRSGILQGVDSAHNCNPDSNIKRGEVAAILTRMMDKTARISFDMAA